MILGGVIGGWQLAMLIIPLGILVGVFFIGFAVGKQKGYSKAKKENDNLL